MTITLEEIQQTHIILCEDALKLVMKKGLDYNRRQQDEGDTLFNLRVSRILGVVETDEASILVRMTDKLMRLISLTAPKEIPKPACNDEKVEDTVKDMINYTVYLYAVHRKRLEETMLREMTG